MLVPMAAILPPIPYTTTAQTLCPGWHSAESYRACANGAVSGHREVEKLDWGSEALQNPGLPHLLLSSARPSLRAGLECTGLGEGGSHSCQTGPNARLPEATHPPAWKGSPAQRLRYLLVHPQGTESEGCVHMESIKKGEIPDLGPFLWDPVVYFS